MGSKERAEVDSSLDYTVSGRVGGGGLSGVRLFPGVDLPFRVSSQKIGAFSELDRL